MLTRATESTTELFLWEMWKQHRRKKNWRDGGPMANMYNSWGQQWHSLSLEWNMTLALDKSPGACADVCISEWPPGHFLHIAEDSVIKGIPSSAVPSLHKVIKSGTLQGYTWVNSVVCIQKRISTHPHTHIQKAPVINWLAWNVWPLQTELVFFLWSLYILTELMLCSHLIQ